MQREAEAPAVEPRDVTGTAGGVELAGVEKAFGAVRALAGVSLRAAPHEVVAVAGPSGCGKSTLLELVCGLAAPDAGTVRSAPAALMPQRDGLLPWLGALDNAALALRVAGLPRGRARAAAREHFAAFGLEGFERARPAALSGGMRQRVAFLRTLLAGRPVLCLDEPFGALDALTRLQMQAWLAGALAREPRTVLLVTHDVEEAVLLADRVVLLSPRPGRVVETLDDRPAAAARARRRRGGGAARAGAARAGGGVTASPRCAPVALTRRSSSSRLALGGARARRRGRRPHPPRPHPGARRALARPRPPGRRPVGDRLRGPARPRGGRRRRRRARRGHAPLRPAAARAAPAGDRLPGGARAGDRAARGARARLRAGAQGPARRARLLLPRDHQPATTACATPTPTRAACCAPCRPRAGRRCACSRRPGRCPRPSPASRSPRPWP